jgi:hypothetical protein
MQDGTRLAADVFHPAHGGKLASERLPAIWTVARYHRTYLDEDRVVNHLDVHPWLGEICKKGYVLGVVDARGTGASFGTRDGPFSSVEARDGYEITEWFAAQPFSTGKVGMFGRSYGGIAQYLVAATAPPHLVAILPEMSLFDLYDSVRPGGILRHDWVHWSDTVRRMDTEPGVAPVDDDIDGALVKLALEEHKGNSNVYTLFADLAFRDSPNPVTGETIFRTRSPATFLEDVRHSGIAIYHLAGWLDAWPRDALAWFRNLDNPQKLRIGPWHHNDTDKFDFATEYLRWWDYWLKGVETGVMEEAPVAYHVRNARDGWRKGHAWPPPQCIAHTLFFDAGPSGSIDSVNDGTLSGESPPAEPSSDELTVDPSTTTGRGTRWSNVYGAPFEYPDLSENDRKGLTYTSPPIGEDLEVVGYPLVKIWFSTTESDADLFVYLEEVVDGFSSYVTEGCLRISHHTTGRAPFDTGGSPYRRSTSNHVSPQHPAPNPIDIELHPTAHCFSAGNRIRITITGCDHDNMKTPLAHPLPSFSILRSAAMPSHVSLPVLTLEE